MLKEPTSTEEPDVISAHHLQRLIGSIGIALPLICIFYGLFGANYILTSVSAFYYTPVHGIFVGTLCALGVCLICYKGYDRTDSRLGTVAGFCAILVALFPTVPDTSNLEGGAAERAAAALVSGTRPIVGPPDPVFCQMLHGVAAIALFVVLTIFAGFLFPRTKPTPNNVSTAVQSVKDLKYIVVSEEAKVPDREKAEANRIYRICALLMAGALLAVPLNAFTFRFSHTLFWSETVAVLAFGISWLTKSHVGAAPRRAIIWGIVLFLLGCAVYWLLNPRMGASPL